MSALQKTPQYGYYPDPDNTDIVEYGDYDTAMTYSPYNTTNPARGSAKRPLGPNGEPPGEGEDQGREDNPDSDKTFDPKDPFGTDPKGQGPSGGPGGGGQFPQRKRGSRPSVLRGGPNTFTATSPFTWGNRYGSSLLTRNDR